MDKVSLTFRVFFEDPFWIGVVERISDGTMEVCKITFGIEPKDYEVYDWLLKNYYRLRFSPAVKAEAKKNIPTRSAGSGRPGCRRRSPASERSRSRP